MPTSQALLRDEVAMRYKKMFNPKGKPDKADEGKDSKQDRT